MTRVLVVRQAERAAETAALLTQQGLMPLILPLETVALLDPPLPPVECHRLVVTSAHALPWLTRHCPPDGRPLYAVGMATAQAAEHLGYSPVLAASGTAASLAEMLLHKRLPGRILYAAGAVRRPDLETALYQAGQAFVTVEVYSAGHAMPARVEVDRVLRGGAPDAVLLLSAGQAAAYALFCRQFDVVRAATAYCLSQRIADTLPPDLGHNSVVSPAPDMESLVGMIRKRRCSMP